MKAITLLFSAIVSSIAVYFASKHANRYLMRFFRDLSRYKSRKRLYGNNAALIPILMGQEEPVELKPEPGTEDFTMTAEQLAEMDGRTEDTPIYLAISGNIYDVSAARHMYGPKGGYHGFVGRDSTRAFANGCLEEHCMTASTEGLTENEMKQVARWLELYHNHDKYKYVGRLVVDPVEEVLKEIDLDAEAAAPVVDGAASTSNDSADSIVTEESVTASSTTENTAFTSNLNENAEDSSNNDPNKPPEDVPPVEW